MISLDNIKFTYEPYPIAVAKNVFDPVFYKNMIDNWPTGEYKSGYRGLKYGISEFSPIKYNSVITSHDCWRQFARYIKSEEFINYILDVLEEHKIKLFLDNNHRKISKLDTRLEFSAIPVKGGHLWPHTDSVEKIVTLIFPIYNNEWDKTYGGKTTILKPKDITEIYDILNQKTLDHNQFDTVYDIPFDANTAIIFVKTYNSWHSVPPMSGTEEDVFRKSLTLNICKYA